jgi:PPM family protein phosphatase
MQLVPGKAQHIGKRDEQEDAFGFSRLDRQEFMAHGGFLAVLTDGMSGMAMGREASQTATAAMLQAYLSKKSSESIPAALQRALLAANEAVLARTRQAGATPGAMGTTLVAAVVRDHELHWVSVGDSRLYHYRQGRLTRLTQDHDFARKLQKLVAAGKMSPEEAETHPQRRALTSYLGIEELTEVDRNVRPLTLQAGDRILLCSDGLYQSLSETEVAAVLPLEPQVAADVLVEQTLAKGKARQDNITVAILACDAAGHDTRWIWNVRRLVTAAAILTLLGLSLWWYLARGAPQLSEDKVKVGPVLEPPEPPGFNPKDHELREQHPPPLPSPTPTPDPAGSDTRLWPETPKPGTPSGSDPGPPP